MNSKIIAFAFVACMLSSCATTAEQDGHEAAKRVNAAQSEKMVSMENDASDADANGDEAAQQDVNAAQSEKTVSTENEAYEDKVRCRRIAKTGTRLGTKVCATNRQWKESAESAERTTEELKRRPQHGRDAG
ncbi:MAG: hypothetical protein OER80_11140 [Gammaproteobacteria bacterium]|nr:hypothetical protein [Gammaproteobacteria bacterium]MDH3768264.1 hypothetical protein [Gammaproteobacteria bacterium]